jgi:hypothetical protein
MNHRIGRSALTLMMLLTLTVQLNLGQVGVQEPQPARKKFSVVGYSPHPVPCHPVQVKATTIGTQPPEVLTAQVTIQSYSEKPIIAVKLSWNVYEFDVAMKKRFNGGCDGNTPAAEIFLSGTTPLISLGQLAKNETCHISTNPLVIKSPATKTAFVAEPIIKWDEVKSLTWDGTRGSFKDDYGTLIYVSEIHYADGSQWTGTIK